MFLTKAPLLCNFSRDQATALDHLYCFPPNSRLVHCYSLQAGDMSPELKDGLRNYDFKFLVPPSQLKPGRYLNSPNPIYRGLQRIATEAYGLTRSEYEYWYAPRTAVSSLLSISCSLKTTSREYGMGLASFSQ